MSAVPDRKITKDDIQAKLQELQGEVDQRTEAAKTLAEEDTEDPDEPKPSK